MKQQLLKVQFACATNHNCCLCAASTAITTADRLLQSQLTMRCLQIQLLTSALPACMLTSALPAGVHSDSEKDRLLQTVHSIARDENMLLRSTAA